MTAVYPSRVWACWDATFDALAAQSWPAHPSTGKVPPVQFAGSRDVAKEMITVPGMKPPQGPTQDYATMGVVGRDETFTLIIYLWSMVAGFTDPTATDPSRAVRHRLRDLGSVVEATFRDQVTGRPAGINILNVWKWEITQFAPAVSAMEGGGYGGDLTIDLTFTART